MIRGRSTLRAPLEWLKAQFGAEPKLPPGGERRSAQRKRMRFEAEIQKVGESVPVIGVDIHEDGARVLAKQSWDTGTVLFLKLKNVQLGGFAEVRHCTRRQDGRYTIGLAFRGPFIPQGEQWQIQRVCQPATEAWTRSDDVPAISEDEPLQPNRPREVA
jgi:hypothetical protein